MKIDKKFYKNRKVFITGNTGFKGAYMCEVLHLLGAKIYGYALKEETLSLYKLLNLNEKISTIYGDIRDYKKLLNAIKKAKPDIVIHMAAQPIVRESYINPAYTYETNVMGTVNVLEAIRHVPSVKSFINVTTDKVYLNKEDNRGFIEEDELNGFDPYSNSKSCSELVTSVYRQCFFDCKKIAITTCRAGNVIGGGDFAKDRIIPDAMRAIIQNKTLIIRNPNSIRPYQHVLEPIYQYLLIAQEQYRNKNLQGAYNIGPNISDCITTKQLIDMLKKQWNKIDSNHKLNTLVKIVSGPKESNYLRLNCSKIKSVLDYSPNWSVETALQKICEFIFYYKSNKDVSLVIDNTIKDFFNSL